MMLCSEFRPRPKGGTSFNHSAPTAELFIPVHSNSRRSGMKTPAEDKNGGIGTAVGTEQGYE